MSYEDEIISLTPKRFDLLLYFVENAGSLAKKGDLLDAVWTDNYIEETTLARNVSWLRKMLRSYSDAEKFIETVPKLGYRFTADVTQSNENENALIIEEQTTHLIRGEETITVDDDDTLNKKQTTFPNPEQEIDRILPTSPRRFTLYKYLTASLALMLFITVGFVVYQNYSKEKRTKICKGYKHRYFYRTSRI